ncbi:MAG: hypothetical protein ACYC3O_01550 [Burkholderiales bacterium]
MSKKTTTWRGDILTMESISLKNALSKAGSLSIQRNTLIIAAYEQSSNRLAKLLGMNREACMVPRPMHAADLVLMSAHGLITWRGQSS